MKSMVEPTDRNEISFQNYKQGVLKNKEFKSIKQSFKNNKFHVIRHNHIDHKNSKFFNYPHLFYSEVFNEDTFMKLKEIFLDLKEWATKSFNIEFTVSIYMCRSGLKNMLENIDTVQLTASRFSENDDKN